jgi:P-type Cu+ transporter
VGQVHVEPHVETLADHQPSPETLTTDPVCGMAVDPTAAPEHRVTGPDIVWFCSAHCAGVFDAMNHDAPAPDQLPGGGIV